MAEERARAGRIAAAGVAPDIKTITSGTHEHDMAAIVAVFNAKQKGPHTPEGDLRGWCELQSALAKTVRSPRVAHWSYSCTYDLVLREGRAYTPRVLPKPYKRLEPHNCFGNSMLLAVQHPTLTYVEGYGLTETGIPSHHAWCVDQDDNVVDSTWAWSDKATSAHLYTAAGALLGVPVPTPLVTLIWSVRTYNGVLEDWEHEYPAFKAPWDPDALAAHYETLSTRTRKHLARVRATKR